ncbi:hypothetical protein FRC00_001709 [Tulasnella sp. 408]|nr:hypothetical protein FRC00_001709 [Tulasnella sp. 408]
MSTRLSLSMALLGTAANLDDIRSPTESGGSLRSTPSEFSAWDTYPETAVGLVRIASPLDAQPPDDHTSEGSNLRSDDGSDESTDAGFDRSNGDEVDWSSEGSGHQLDQELAATNSLRNKINSSIVIGQRMVLNAHQRLTRTRMFDLEMSEAKGGMVFDYDESRMILGFLCRIQDSRRIQGEAGPTLIVAPSEGQLEKWARAARDFSDEFNRHTVLIYHGRRRTLSGDLGLIDQGLLREGFSFLRVILDGGEVIRNQGTGQSEACRQVNALYHWCCTQNSKTIAPQQYEVFAEYLRVPNPNAAREFLDQFILGDLDDEAVATTPTSELEHRSLIFQEVEFDRGQREFYLALEKRLNEIGGQHLRPRALRSGGAELAHRMVLLSLKACCHFDLAFRGSGATDNHNEGVRTCIICEEEERAYTRSNYRSCNVCHEKVMSRFPTGPSRLANPKIREMLNILHRTAKVTGGKGKTAIICQFSGFADIVAEHLTREGIGFARFHDLNLDEKYAAMRRVRSQRDIVVVLATVNPANIHGLDFRPITTVILMDLWWNPQLDVRAFRDDHDVMVNIYKLYVENTVESRVLEVTSKVAEPTAAGQ